MQTIDSIFHIKLNHVIVLVSLFILQGCGDNNNETIPTLCVEGEFIDINIHCQASIGDEWQSVSMYKVQVLDNDTLGLINVPIVDLPEQYRVTGIRFFFQIDSVGRFGVCNALGGWTPTPLRISRVSSIPCGNKNR